MNNQPESYEGALAELQEIVKQLEEGTISIGDLTSKAERALQLIQYCKDKLRQTEIAVERLFEG